MGMGIRMINLRINVIYLFWGVCIGGMCGCEREYWYLQRRLFCSGTRGH